MKFTKMNMTHTPPKKICSAACGLMFVLLLAGCTLMQLREEVKFGKNSKVLVGNVSSTLSLGDTPVVVAAYSKKDGRRTITHYTTLHEPGPYELMVPDGIHNIVAFADRNRNLMYDKGEPAGQILSADRVSAPVGGVTGNLDIVISEHGTKEIDFPVGSILPPKEYRNFHSTCPGAIANVEDVLFSDEYGKKGFWTPIGFFKEISGNVYFLEDYDPKKIPILFVHGAAGSPRDWKVFFEGIDRSRYQPWFFYYPSGAPIDSMSYLLLWKLQNLQTKYKFKKLVITAHSMGGLVIRSFLVNYGRFFPSITTFISISTPWGGEELAEIGVKYSPAVIPVWKDIQPESKFIHSIFQKNMPPSVEHYLFFGHRGNRNVLRPNNDMVVTLASQLDQRSQRDAKMVYGFDEDHVSILSSELVLSQYTAILDDNYQKTQVSDKIPGNRLQVDFSFDFPKELPKPMSALLFRPVDKKEAETWIYLSPENTGRKHGPFPPGKYEVSIIAPGFRPEPVSILVAIEERMVPSVEFLMKPVGSLRGYVVKNEQRDIHAGKYRPPDTEAEIESITLRGNGVYRTLVPLQEEKARYSDYELSATDFSSGGYFFFYNLPAGKYELTILAKGYKPYTESCNVKPGQYQNAMIIELVKQPADST